MFDKLSKSVKSHHLLVLLGLVVLGVALMQYSGKKSVLLSGMDNQEIKTPIIPSTSYGAAAPKGQNSGPASINGIGNSGQGSTSSCSQKAVADPKDLLPNVTNNEWSDLTPSSPNLSGVNLLKAGHHVGINTISGSLRNANLQVRSEPANPKSEVGPWNGSTIEPDLMRPSLEIGSGCI